MTKRDAQRLTAIGNDANRPENPRPNYGRLVTVPPRTAEDSHVHCEGKAVPTTATLMRRLLGMR